MNYSTPYLARRGLPGYFLNERNGNRNRPLTTLEEFIIDESDNLTESELIKVCETLLKLLDNPEQTPALLQLLHGVWVRGPKVLYTYRGIEPPEKFKVINEQVSEKALNNKAALAQAMKKWQCINHE